MKRVANYIYRLHRNFWTKEHTSSFIEGVIIFTLAIVTQRLSNKFVARVEGVPVDDLILNVIPTINTSFFIIQGALILTLAVIILLILKPKYFLFTIKAISIFIIIRSFFISLTHLGINPNQLIFNTDRLGYELYNIFFYTKGDFFFSGHTGIPFLVGLIFWKEKYLRYFFFIVSAVLGVSMLLAHIHYSIDVFAAPFITYSIYALTRKIFTKDHELTQ